MDSSLCIKGDYFYVISKFLNPMDIVNVYRSYPMTNIELYPLFTESICKKIDVFFREYFGNRYDEFRKIMIESKSVISGSFIIQMILGENWIKSDIDILVQKENRVIENFSLIENFLYKDHEYDDVDDPDLRGLYGRVFEGCLNRVRNYEPRDNKTNHIFSYFQVISIHQKSIMKLINKHIDFDICKNMFWYDENGYNIYINNPNNIIHKKFTGRTNWTNPTYNEPVNRKEKYENRGFTFI